MLNQIDVHNEAIALTEQALHGELSQAEWREALNPLLMASESRAGEAVSIVTIGDIEGGIHDSIIAERNVIQTIVNIFRGDTNQQRTLRNRQAMLKLVKDFWVKDVLENSLHAAVLIELGMDEHKDAMEHPWIWFYTCRMSLPGLYPLVQRSLGRAALSFGIQNLIEAINPANSRIGQSESDED